MLETLIIKWMKQVLRMSAIKWNHCSFKMPSFPPSCVYISTCLPLFSTPHFRAIFHDFLKAFEISLPLHPQTTAASSLPHCLQICLFHIL